MQLLDFLDQGDDKGLDPRQMGLLSLGLRLMSTPGNFGAALGQSGMGALGDYQGALQQQRKGRMDDLQARLHALQLQGAQRQADRQQRIDDLAPQFATTAPQEALRSGAAAGSVGPTVGNAARIPAARPGFDFNGYAEALASIDPQASLSMRQALAKDESPVALADGGMLVTRSGKVLAQNPKDTPKSDIAKLIMEMQALPEGHPMRAAYMSAIQKASTHQPPIANLSVSMDKGFGEAFAKDAAARLSASRDQALAAQSSNATISRIEAAAKNGKIFSGPVGDVGVALARMGELAGINGKDTTERLRNTTSILQASAQLAMDGAAQMKGQGQITEGERQLIDRVSGGKILSLTPAEIPVLLGTLRKINDWKIRVHQGLLKSVPQEMGKYAPFYNVDQSTDMPGSSDSGWGIVGRRN